MLQIDGAVFSQTHAGQADPVDGAVQGFRWRPAGPCVLAPIGAGRPLR